MIVILYTQTHQKQFDVDTCANSIFEIGQNWTNFFGQFFLKSGKIVCSGGRVPATPVPIQVHANARGHETTPGSRQPRRRFHNHAGNNDLVPDQHGGKIWPNSSSVLIVNKWSVLLSQCTTTFHSDGLVN